MSSKSFPYLTFVDVCSRYCYYFIDDSYGKKNKNMVCENKELGEE